MHDYYQLVTVADLPQDNRQILDTLTAIGAGKLPNDLRLLNYYRSIPVNYGATVESVERGSVELTVNQQQAIVMQLEKQVFLKSGHFPKDVLAAVTYVNIDKSVAILANFAYAVIRSERRQFVRVEVKDKIEASFSGDGFTVAGQLNDISLGGVAISATIPTHPDAGIKGKVTLRLPGGPFEMPAQVLRVIPAKQTDLCIIEIQPDNRTEKGISQYIFQRQVEIIRELKDSIF
ncbi:pilus assembly protein PilZ [Geobacter sulfurreducens]|nr:pilus assembly protein PilZ [Geobacter sulfurreducens]